MNKIRILEKIVKEILEEDELAREDDCFLILQVIRKLYPNDVAKSFEEVMENGKSKGISFESITRVRRKVQEKYPELRDIKTVKKRECERHKFMKYAVEGGERCE